MLSHFDFCFGLKINVTFVSLSFSFWLVLFDFFYIQPWSCHLILLFPGLCMVIVFLSVFIAVLKSFITFVFVFFPLFLSIFFPVTLYLFVGLYWRVLLFSSLICRFLFSSNFFCRIAPVCHCLQNQKGLLMSAVVLFLPRFELCISVWRGFLQWQKGF